MDLLYYLLGLVAGAAVSFCPIPRQQTSTGNWRVGSKVPLNVYKGDRPICQCHNEEDAKLIVNIMNLVHSAGAKNSPGQSTE